MTFQKARFLRNEKRDEAFGVFVSPFFGGESGVVAVLVDVFRFVGCVPCKNAVLLLLEFKSFNGIEDACSRAEVLAIS